MGKLIDSEEIEKREHDVILANGAKHHCFDTTILYEIPEGVVRCKDCKHYWESARMCCFADLPINDSVKPEDYCSRGERREDGKAD